jgi:hypothetical protein
VCKEVDSKTNELQIVFKDIEALNFNPSCAEFEYLNSGKCYLVYKKPRSEKVLHKLGPFDFDHDVFTLVKRDKPREVYDGKSLKTSVIY